MCESNCKRIYANESFHVIGADCICSCVVACGVDHFLPNHFLPLDSETNSRSTINVILISLLPCNSFEHVLTKRIMSPGFSIRQRSDLRACSSFALAIIPPGVIAVMTRGIDVSSSPWVCNPIGDHFAGLSTVKVNMES